MRIISGKYRGQKLKSLAGLNTRPTTDRVKEAIFNLLGLQNDFGLVLDLFAGSGALAIEAISRGATTAVIVDSSWKALKVAQENVSLLNHDQDKFIFYRNSASAVLPILAEQQFKFNLIFLDPPYARQEIQRQLQKMLILDLIANQAQVVVETKSDVEMPEKIGSLVLKKKRTYGITKIRIYEN
jgi:16S rRNA (guanine966-N2)-methyltransferase